MRTIKLVKIPQQKRLHNPRILKYRNENHIPLSDNTIIEFEKFEIESKKLMMVVREHGSFFECKIRS